MIEIRQMQFDDIDAVCEIEKENFSIPWTETGFFTYLIRDDSMFLVACDGEKTVGYCGLLCVPEDGDITNIAVAKDRWGEGIGSLILKEVIEKAAQRGVYNIFLEVRKSNERAIALYKKFGFEDVGLRKNYYEQPVEDGVLMKHVYADNKKTYQQKA